MSKTVNFNKKVKITLLVNDQELTNEDINKIYGESDFEHLIATVPILNKEFINKIGKGFVNDKVTRMLVNVELKRADRL